MPNLTGARAAPCRAVPQSLPYELRSVASLLKDHLPRFLGPNLVGIYVYGSALDSSFVSGRSDLDCHLVTEAPLLGASYGAREAGAEGVVVEPSAPRWGAYAPIRQRPSDFPITVTTSIAPKIP
jgi:hypothetical protein